MEAVSDPADHGEKSEGEDGALHGFRVELHYFVPFLVGFVSGPPILTSNRHDRWLPLVREAEEPLFRLYKDGWCLYVSTLLNMRVAFARLEAERQKAAETAGKAENYG